MVPPQYIYIVLFGFPWIWTILFFLNIVKKNPIPSSAAGLIFTTWALLLSPWHEKFSLFFCIPMASNCSLKTVDTIVNYPKRPVFADA